MRAKRRAETERLYQIVMERELRSLERGCAIKEARELRNRRTKLGLSQNVPKEWVEVFEMQRQLN